VVMVMVMVMGVVMGVTTVHGRRLLHT
jgi:hypothetical protein